MPPKKPTIWPAEPHTLAKIAILRDYLIRWFQILGTSSISRGQDLIYVDGFAGPGEYTNHKQGSPLEALIAAKKARADSRTQWKAGRIHCVFIEADRARFEHLRDRVRPFEGSDEVVVHLIEGQFTDGIRQLQEEMPNVFNKSFPLFVFIDPFGAKGVPFQRIAEILKGGCAEVLIYLDADGIVRNFLAPKTSAHESLLSEVFGDNSWRTFQRDIPFGQQCQRVLELYKDKIYSEAKYVFSFEMRTSEKSLNYYLVFAGQHRRGLEKMKESMRKIDQDGSYRFSDASVGQTVMFRADNPELYATRMHTRFSGTGVTFDTLWDYALNETPFINPKSMLAILEKEDRIIVEASEVRRRGTFNPAKIKMIRFV